MLRLLSFRFRLAARGLHAFLAAQIPGDGSSLRCIPNASGHVCQVKGSSAKESPTAEAKDALQGLINLQKSKSYSGMKTELQWIIQFISDPNISLVDGPKFFAYICSQLFYKISYVVVTCQC